MSSGGGAPPARRGAGPGARGRGPAEGRRAQARAARGSSKGRVAAAPSGRSRQISMLAADPTRPPRPWFRRSAYPGRVSSSSKVFAGLRRPPPPDGTSAKLAGGLRRAPSGDRPRSRRRRHLLDCEQPLRVAQVDERLDERGGVAPPDRQVERAVLADLHTKGNRQTKVRRGSQGALALAVLRACLLVCSGMGGCVPPPAPRRRS